VTEVNVRELPPEERAVRRYVEDLWVPYNRELEGIVEGFSLAEDVDVVPAELEYRLDRLDSETFRCWIAVDGEDGAELAATDGDFVGFVTTDLDEAPPVFDRPDRVVICDLYVEEPYRGTGLARELVGIASTEARERGCPELKLEVDVPNDRAVAFYEKLGFEPVRHAMVRELPGN
jgi:ribosomal protein S18 acetylase RimI-like enzyme